MECKNCKEDHSEETSDSPYELSSAEYAEAADYWHKKDAEAVQMDRDALIQTANGFLSSHNTCALATGSGEFIRCTPLEYTWHDGAVWIFTEGGEKFIGLEKNRNVCLAVYESYTGFGSIQGMQVSGTAAMIQPFCKAYEQEAQIRKIPLEAMKKLPEPMHLIRVMPTEAVFTNSDFKKNGFGSRQHIRF